MEESSSDSNIIYSGQAPPNLIESIKSSGKEPPSLKSPAFGMDNPMGAVFSGITAPMYIYASLKGKHDLWDRLLKDLPDTTFQGPSLDMGCGRGMVLLKTAQRKKAIGGCQPAYGIDIFNSYDQTGNAPEATYANVACLDLLDQIVLHSASFTDPLPFADGSFSLITASLSLHNADDAGRKRAVEELARVCAPGGQVIHNIQNSFSLCVSFLF